MWDTHTHCFYSGDSVAEPWEMIKSAKAIGLDGIYFTDHHDVDYPKAPDEPDFLLDIPSYNKIMKELSAKYSTDSFTVRTGIELGLQAHLAGTLPNALTGTDFDFCIGSTHVAEHTDPYYGKFYEGRSEEDAYRAYFEATLQNALLFDCYDTYAHLDYVVRYGPNKNKDYHYGTYADVLDEILKTLIKKEKALELNTSGWKYGLGQPHPCEEILTRYRELSGKLLTIGSDAHSEKFVGYDFQKAADLLIQIGFTHYTIYRAHKPEMIALK
jgi:histidinol-phosphatase (PHP family)